MTALQADNVCGKGVGAVVAGLRRGTATGPRIVAGLGIVCTAAETEFGQHRARFDGGKLVLIAEEDEAGRRRQGAEQGGHHLLMNHGGFVHHEYVEFEGIGGVMAKATTVGAGAEQAVQGTRRTQAGEGGSHVGYPAQLRKSADRAPQGFVDAHGGLAGGGGEDDAQGCAAGRHEQGHEAGCGVGFAGAGAAGDDAEVAAQGEGAGDFLPGEFIAGFVRCREKLLQPGS